MLPLTLASIRLCTASGIRKHGVAVGILFQRVDTDTTLLPLGNFRQKIDWLFAEYVLWLIN
jgi:hypothetical protein